MNSRGKRMVQEDELTYLQELKAAHSDPSAEWGGGGSSLEAGAGIDITEGVLSVDYGAGLTVDDGTLVVDASTVAMKSDLATVATTGSYSDLTGTPSLATVATTGDYNDLTNKPTIMPTIELTYGTPATAEQIATFEVGAKMIFDMYGTKSTYYCNRSDSDYWYFHKLDPELTTADDYGKAASQLRIPVVSVNKAAGNIDVSWTTTGSTYFDPETMKQTSNHYITTVIGGGVDSQIPLVTSEFSLVDTTAYCSNNKINYYFAYAAIETYKIPDTGFYVKVGGLYDTNWRIINFTTSTSGTDVIFTVNNTDVKTSGTWFTYDTTTNTITATGSVFDEYTDTFYNSYVNVSDQKYVKELDSVAAKEAGLISTVDAAFIPVDGTSITVDSNGKLAATGGSSSGKYLHKVKIYANFSGIKYWTEEFVSSSATSYTSVSDYLTDRGYTITDTSDQPTKSFDTYAGTSIEAIAYRNEYGIYISQLNINSSGAVTYGTWSLQSSTPAIQDEVIAL